MCVDWLAGILAWFSFFVYRKNVEAPGLSYAVIIEDPKLLIGIIVIPAFWLVLWFFLGTYQSVLRKSRLQTLYKTFGGVLLGALILLFAIIRDDLTLEVISYLTAFINVLLIHFGCFAILRLVYLSILKQALRTGRIQHKGILLKDSVDANVPIPRYTRIISTDHLKNWSAATDLQDIDTLVIDTADKEALNRLISNVIGKVGDRAVFLTESSFGLLDYDYDGSPRLGEPFVMMKTMPIAHWQRNLKRTLDIMISSISLFILSPLFLYLSRSVRKSSEGPVFFVQDRIGKNGTVFPIFKFRTMYENAEVDGPALATKDDNRCTPTGKWMRRWRLDEIPQFYNVLKGDMSLVGPRPERPFYAEQLVAQNPRYPLLWQVRPGITSWGQIKFGYASSIDEMLRRFRYDLLYLENMSILLDLRIIYYTLIVLWQGKGR